MTRTRLTAAAPGARFCGVTFLSGPIRAAVDTAPAAAEGKNLVLFGARIGRQCIEHGLVDELLIHLVPVLLGDGLRLFERSGSQPPAPWASDLRE